MVVLGLVVLGTVGVSLDQFTDPEPNLGAGSVFLVCLPLCGSESSFLSECGFGSRYYINLKNNLKDKLNVNFC
jgi:hypothetical protein